MNHLILISILILTSFNQTILSQKDFNNYNTLQSEGVIPSDFSSLTFEKIQEEIEKKNDEKLSKSQEKLFLEGIHYGIDDILHSGLVVYGDEVSQYIKKIADKLLENEPLLKEKLRFYTLKSNEVNAFSTDQGIVFVTTGLISQLSCEAQLALVLSHEIVHYTEKHVVESFEYKINAKNSGNLSIGKLSIYSKDKEFEADKLGLKWYNSAGYSKNEILSTFDVMMYSYLPFDEVEFPVNYFNSSNLYVPESLFPSVKYEITAIEDYDDSESSHPNIKSRKEKIESELQEYKKWGNNRFLIGEKEFNYIRTICRYESVRTDVMNTNYIDALYSIFLLEKEFKNSIYLQRMKAQIWLGLTQLKKNGSINDIITNTSNLEGEIAALHYFIKKINQPALYTIALRQVYDLKKVNQNDKQINAIYQHLLLELASTKEIDIKSFSKKNFATASTDFLEKTASPVQDTVLPKNTATKYDKIKSKKSIDNPVNFDSTKFYLYGISDIIIDTAFTSLFHTYEKQIEKQELENSKVEKLSEKEQKKALKKSDFPELNLDIDHLIVVEPMVFRYSKDEIDLEKSEILKHDFSEIIESSAIDTEMKIHTIDRDHLAKNGTTAFNERNTLFSLMRQISNEKGITFFPVDYELLNEIKTSYGTSKAMFSLVEYRYTFKIHPASALLVLVPIVYPILPIVIPSRILKGHNTEMNVIIIDLEKATELASINYYTNDTPKKLHLGAHIFDIFKKLKMKKQEEQPTTK